MISNEGSVANRFAQQVRDAKGLEKSDGYLDALPLSLNCPIAQLVEQRTVNVML